jgi:hypothetical protein
VREVVRSDLRADRILEPTPVTICCDAEEEKNGTGQSPSSPDETSGRSLSVLFSIRRGMAAEQKQILPSGAQWTNQL